jgi:hypothetical protein
MSQRVVVVQVGTSGRRRVCESSLCPSACLCEDLLQLKRVEVEGLSGEGYHHGRRRNKRIAGSCQRASTKSSTCLDERINVKCEGGGKPVKGSLFNEDLSLHEAGVDGVVHEVVGMYCARVDGVFHGC